MYHNIWFSERVYVDVTSIFVGSSLLLCDLHTGSMAVRLEGPTQRGQGVTGQYVYWICMPFPLPETVASNGVKTPDDFDRESFRAVVVEAHAFAEVTVLETTCFQEPHASGKLHLNLLVRSQRAYRWLKVAERLLQHHKIHVGFGQNVKSWAEGVIYGRVGSEHKRPESLDHNYTQWHHAGEPTPLDQFLPRRWQVEGFVRQTRLSNLQFFDLCAEHSLADEDALWAKATELSDSGDRALLAFLLDNDARACFAKVQKAAKAKEKVRRASLTREQLLEECVQKEKCTCATEGHSHDLMKEILRQNGLDGTFQKAVLGTFRSGRAKMRNICLLGNTDCGKSFLFKGLEELFATYTRPDGGGYQLEDLLDAEVVFLNDFEYDTASKEWMPWSYFKTFLEGAKVKVGVPKTRGGNQVFKGTAPVFMTAPQEVTLKKGGQEVFSETNQMRRRILYFTLHWQIPEDKREEVLRVCAHCSARLYLEGKVLCDSPNSSASSSSAAAGTAAAPNHTGGPFAKRQRTAVDTVTELKHLADLLSAGLLSRGEFEGLKAKLLEAA